MSTLATEPAVYEFKMPSLGADMETGILSRWLVAPGDRVERGDVVALVETVKSDIEVEVFRSGVVDELVVDEGREVPVGTVLARLRTGEEAEEAAEAPEVEEAPETAPEPAARPEVARETAAAREAEARPPRPERPPPPPRPAATPAPPGAGRVRASPAARRRAAQAAMDLAELEGSGPGGAVLLADVERAVAAAPSARPAPPAPPVRAHAVARKMAGALGIDLAEVEGTGAHGVITRADVERATARPAAREAPPEGPVEAARRRAAAMRGTIAAAMARSKREIPHYYLATPIDLSKALAWLERANLERPVTGRLLPATLLLKATAEALIDSPELNGFWEDGAFRPGEAIHLGIGISLRGGGLVAPALRDAGSKDLDGLMAALKDLVQRTRAGRLRSSEMSGGTLTVTNLGDQGVESVFGIIYPPQVALVGFGRIAERPWAEGGMVGARPTVTATLAADHRASDGHQGARFLARLDELLQRPEALQAPPKKEAT